jgi:hypothetical protein
MNTSNHRQWETGLFCFDCTNCGYCCLACVFLFAVFGCNVHLAQTALEPDNLPQCPACPAIVPVCACLTYFTLVSVGGWFGNAAIPGLNFLVCLPVAMHAYVRNAVRSHDSLPTVICGINFSSVCGDCCLALCCYSCAMAQEHAELVYLRYGLPLHNERNPVNSMMPLMDTATVVRLASAYHVDRNI